MKESRINDFLASVAEAKGVSESILIGGTSKNSGNTDATTNGNACINGNVEACNLSRNDGNCRNAQNMCEESSNGGNCDNNYKPAT